MDGEPYDYESIQYGSVTSLANPWSLYYCLAQRGPLASLSHSLFSIQSGNWCCRFPCTDYFSNCLWGRVEIIMVAVLVLTFSSSTLKTKGQDPRHAVKWSQGVCLSSMTLLLSFYSSLYYQSSYSIILIYWVKVAYSIVINSIQ